jgi:RNA polymerase primary sigma factor
MGHVRLDSLPGIDVSATFEDLEDVVELDALAEKVGPLAEDAGYSQHEFFPGLAYFSVLTRREERDLFRRMAGGDETARAELINRNLRLVASVVRRYRGQGLPLADLVQEGYFGLSRAIDKFDYQRGYKLSTYATIWIRQACLRALASQGQAIALPEYMRSQRNVVASVAAQFAAAHGREPSLEQLVAETGLSEAEVRDAQRASEVIASLNVELADDGSAMLAFIADDNIEDLASQAERQRIGRSVREALATLSALERNVLELRFFTADQDGLSRSQVGERLGLSRGRVALIEREALDILRSRLADLGDSLDASS